MVIKQRYDQRHTPIFFSTGDYVYLRLAQGADPGYVLPSRNITRKLSQRHIKCRVIERVGRLAYRLQLPPELAGAHPVVSVQHLERAPAEGHMTSTEPPSTHDPRFPDDTDLLEDEEAYTSCIKLEALNEVREKLAKPYARTPHVALRVPTDGVHVTTLIFRTPSPGLLALLLS